MLLRKSDATDKLNSLLRGEISAIETYHQALSKIGETDHAADIRRLHDDHIEAANILRKHIHGHGGEPAKSSGAWGAFAKAVAGTAKLFGTTAALKALKEGEEQGIFEYENAIKDYELPKDCRDLIETRLLPQTKAHIPVLDHLLTMVA
jgi:uncharacterized protein (TIGR02284 family)